MLSYDAVQHSSVNLAYRVKDDGMFMFAKGETGGITYWTETESGKVKKFGGNTGINEDWTPVQHESEQHRVFTSKVARDLTEFIKEPWGTAVEASPLRIATRRKQNDTGYMVRFADGTTFSEIGRVYVKIDDKQFRSFDGWQPVTEEHPLYSFLAPYAERDPKKLYRLEKTGPKPLPSRKDYVPVDPLTLQAAGTIATCLANAYSTTVTTEGKVTKDAVLIRDSLLQLSKSIGWLMNEGRGDYLKKNDPPASESDSASASSR